VTWAQRSSSSDPEKNYVYLTIVAADVPESDLKLDLKDASLSFKGASTSKKVTYAIDLDFYAEIDPKESKISHSGRDVSLVLRKKDLKEEFWPRLLKDSKKVHFLKTDFDKWVDEDEQDEAP
ncbi:HSP20-like chaperone, partial [Ampelomyces quisqualis]